MPRLDQDLPAKIRTEKLSYKLRSSPVLPSSPNKTQARPMPLQAFTKQEQVRLQLRSPCSTVEGNVTKWSKCGANSRHCFYSVVLSVQIQGEAKEI